MTLISVPQDFLQNPRTIAWFRLLLRCQAMLPRVSNVKVLVVSQKVSEKKRGQTEDAHVRDLGTRDPRGASP